MFKKVEIWILYLVVLLGIPFTLFFGVLVRQETEGITKKGNVDISFLTKPAASITRIPEQLIRKLLKPNPNIANSKKTRVDENLLANKYRNTTNGFNGTPNSSKSYLLLSRYNGDLNEGIVELIDLMNFQVLHTWNPDIDDFNNSVKKVDEFKYLNRDRNNSRIILRHPLLLKDGGLVFQNHTPLIKIDSCSNQIFQNIHDEFHHSIEVDIDGNIWVPSHLYPQSLPVEKVGRDIKENSGFVDEGIVKLSPDGEILFEKSVSQIFIDNGLEYLLFASSDFGFTKDPLHLNDIQPVDFDGEFWEKGDLFLSLRNQSMVLLYRPSSNKIVWKGVGPFFYQHDVDILNDHKISIFNNNLKNSVNGNFVDGHNEVIIYDFKTNQYSPYQSNSLMKNDVRTAVQGRSEILPNGDLFVEETTYGRTLYFNSDGSLRWTHVNRADNLNIYGVGWSRIMYTKNDIKIVKNFLQTRIKCND